MDKYEYKVRSEEISNLIDKEKYTQAVSLADTIDWRRVKSVTMLLKIAALYRVSRRNEDSRAILLLAYERYPTNRSVMYSLCEVSIELDDIVAAIEYYKQFVKLAPKDNGVFTLRYRILETQEASLEERIEILEELKKRDYQEEWAYELAYLYHRVGLATKCVEECDDIILWFGDGPYVMKAMELKMLHVPLTQTQQAKYNGMLNNSGRNYSEDAYNNTEGYDNTQSYDNAEGYDNTQGYDNDNTQSYDNTENYNIEDYNTENYGGNDNAENDCINDNTGSYPADAIGAESGYAEETYAENGYGQQTGYDGQGSGYGQEGGYAQETYPESGYEQQAGYDGQEGGYAQETFPESYGQQTGYDGQGSGYGQEDGYAQETYPESGYEQQAGYGGQGRYAESDYGGQSYENRTDGYAQNGFVEDGYGNFSYAGSSYPDGYTGEFFAEQVYDGNGNGYSYADSYEEDYGGAAAGQVQEGDPDHGAMRREEPSDAAVPAAGDMSQYNTINLQKVVAESMKELFPDDDVFEEEQKKFYAEEIEEKVSGDTLIYENCKDFLNRRIEQMGEAPSVPEEDSGHSETENRLTYTGKMSKMEDGVSETVPEPHTGAVSKVILPGNTARIIKDEADIASLRSTTERTVEDEHIRMENNDENVYHEKSIMDLEPAEKNVSSATGPMRLDEVLEEWERKKLDNARKHQEEIKQHVLTQTGKIFAEFDSALKSGILGELEREEEESGKAPDKVSDQGFLEADVTSDIPQEPVEAQEEPEDEFDVSYVTEEEKAEKLQAEQKAEYISELGRVLSEELGSAKEEEPQQITSDNGPDVIQEVFYNEEDVSGEAVEHSDEKKNADVETAENNDDEKERHAEAVPAAQTAPIPYYGDDVIYEEEEAAGEYDDQEYRDQEYNDEEYHEDNTETAADESVMDTEPAPPAHYGRDQSIELTKRLTAKIASYEKAVSEKGVSSGNVDYVKYYGEDSIDYTEDSRRNKNAADDTELFDQPVRGQDTHSELRAVHKDKLKELDPEDAESIAEMAKEDALKTQEIKMNTADLSSLSEKIVATTKKEATGARREEIREFTVEEQELFENFAVTKKIKKQIIYALDNMTLSAYTGNVIITGDAGIDTVRMARNLMKKYQAGDENFSGKAAKITGERLNHRNIQEVFDKINNGGIIIEKANGMSEEKLYEMALLLNQENLGIVVIMEDTKKEIARLLQKQAMIADYFNIRIDLMEMDNNALVAYARNYALALEYAIDELGILALYTRIANMQSGNHVVTKDEVRGIIDEAIWKSKKSKIKNFVDVLFARRYDSEDMIVLKERDFI